jgi:PAS domain S-box-containing protein
MNHFTPVTNVPGLSASSRSWSRALLFLGSGVIASLTLALDFRIQHPARALFVLGSITAALLIAICLHVGSLFALRRRSQNAAIAFDEVDRELKSVFEHTLDGIVVLDASGACLHANRSACNLLHASEGALFGRRLSNFLAKSDNGAQWEGLWERECGWGEAKFLRRDGTTVFVEYAVSSVYPPRKYLAVLRDVTDLKDSQVQFGRCLASAQAAAAEADILRRSTHILTQGLRMDHLLDNLLSEMGKLVPFDSATVLLREDGDLLLVAREAPHRTERKRVVTFRGSANCLVEKVLNTAQSVCLSDTRTERDWTNIESFGEVRSWIGVPLVSSHSVLGLLSVGCRKPNTFTADHLRVAKSLALSAAVAIQNARLSERAEVFAVELESRLNELSRMREALRAASRS